MKNLAICISGSLRSFEFTLNNFIENIIEPNKNDFNIHYFFFLPNDKNSYKIKLFEKYNPNIIIKDDITLEYPNIKWGASRDYLVVDDVSIGGLQGWLQQIKGVQESYNMVTDFQNKNNIKFDIILRVRSDVLFKNKLIIKNYDIDNKIIVPNFHSHRGINDRLAFGNINNMKVYMNMYSNLYTFSNSFFKEKNEKLYIFNAETFTKFNLEVNNINYYSDNNILFNRVRENNKILKDF